MKKFISIFLVAVMLFSLCACGKPAEVKYHIGDTVSTDIISFKLDLSCFAIALHNDFYDIDNHFMPKEYNKVDDRDNPCVAKQGHILVPIIFEISCIKDRVDCQWDTNFASITYKGKEYTNEPDNEIELQHLSSNGYNRFFAHGTGWPVQYSEIQNIRYYLEVPVEPADLNEPFDLHIKLKNSSGEEETFTFEINK